MKILLITKPDRDSKNGAIAIEHIFAGHAEFTRNTSITGVLFDDIDLVVLCGRPDLLATKHNFKESRKHIYRQWGTTTICTWDAKYAEVESEVPELGFELINDIVWGVNMVEGGEVSPPRLKQGKPTERKVGWDLETTSLKYWDPQQRILTSVIAGKKHWTDSVEDHEEFLYDPEATVIGHNIKFDFNWWHAKMGRQVKAKPFSTDVAAFLLNDNATDNTLEYSTTRLLQWGNHKTLDRKDLSQYNRKEILNYNIVDSSAGPQLMTTYAADLASQGLLPYFDLLMDVLPVFSKMEVRGIQLDQPWTMKVGDQIWRERDEAIAKLPVDNPNSDRQLAKLLFEDMEIPARRRTKTGQACTDATSLKLLLLPSEGLKKCQTDMIQWVLDYRKVDKLWSGYFNKFPELVQYDGRIHGQYAIAKGEDGGAGTGRTSCRNPNLQNIPNRSDVRGCFCATFGFKWGDADYSGLEMAIAADIAGETQLIEAIRAGRDPHTAMMARIYNEDYEEIADILATRREGYAQWKQRRTATKRVNFGILYGISAARLHIMLLLEGIYMSVEECQDLIDQWLRTNAGINQWLRSTESTGRSDLEVVAPTGAKRRLPGANRYDWVGSRRARQATNFPIQHTASALLLTAMVLLDEWFEQKGDAHLLMNVHDQVAFEFKGDEEEITENVTRIMQEDAPKEFTKRFGYEFQVPFKIDLNIADRWT
jgi:DNA polymerase I-like protein with 3'-5' exonuclease and polymerase domains